MTPEQYFSYLGTHRQDAGKHLPDFWHFANASQTICIAGAFFGLFRYKGPPGGNGMYEGEHGERHQRSCIFHAGAKRGAMGVAGVVLVCTLAGSSEQNKSMDF